MATYGRSFTLAREQDNGLGEPAPQKGQAGPYTREAGSLGYNEVRNYHLFIIFFFFIFNQYPFFALLIYLLIFIHMMIIISFHLFFIMINC